MASYPTVTPVPVPAIATAVAAGITSDGTADIIPDAISVPGTQLITPGPNAELAFTAGKGTETLTHLGWWSVMLGLLAVALSEAARKRRAVAKNLAECRVRD